MKTKEKGFLTRETASNEFPQLLDIKPLMGKLNYLDILHEGETYRLRVTKFRKLILTK
ncbi:MAG: Hemin uptake protein hemP [Pseudomonadota bacterium]|jgi:hemin uptake protein HemP